MKFSFSISLIYIFKKSLIEIYAKIGKRQEKGNKKETIWSLFYYKLFFTTSSISFATSGFSFRKALEFSLPCPNLVSP
jgi:hypothetical protein